MLVNGETIRRPIGRASEIGRKAIWMNDFDARYAGLWSLFAPCFASLEVKSEKSKISRSSRLLSDFCQE